MMGYYSSLHPSMWGFGGNAPAAKQYSSSNFGCYPHHPHSQSNPHHQQQQQQHQLQHHQTTPSAPSLSSVKQESLKCEQPATSDYSTGSSSSASQQQSQQQQQANLSPSPPSPQEDPLASYSQSKVVSHTAGAEAPSSPPTAYPYFSSVPTPPASSSALSPTTQAYYSTSSSSTASYQKQAGQLLQHPSTKSSRARPKSTAGMSDQPRLRGLIPS